MSEFVPYKPHPHDFTKIWIDDITVIERHIVCAANKFNHNCEEIIVAGARHWDNIMCNVVDVIGIDDKKDHEQGFIDQYGLFITRKEACEIVLTNKQSLRDTPLLNDLLFSENLY